MYGGISKKKIDMRRKETDEEKMNRLREKWNFDSPSWDGVSFTTQPDNLLADGLRIQCFLRQAYDTGSYRYDDSWKYLNIQTLKRLAKFIHLIRNAEDKIESKLSAEKMMEALNSVSYINIAPPLLLGSDKENKKSYWNDLKFYFKSNNYQRGRQCFHQMMDFKADVVIFVGTYGIFYDLFALEKLELPIELMECSGNKVFEWHGQLLIEIKHISSRFVPNQILEKLNKKIIETRRLACCRYY